MGATKLMTAAGGGITLDAASTASDKTITVPADNGTLVYANSSGNVGIGTTSPTFSSGGGLHVNVAGAGPSIVHLTTGNQGTTASDGLDVKFYAGDATLWNYETGYMAFATSNAERARIDSSGALLVNATSKVSGTTYLSVQGSTASSNIMEQKDTGTSYASGNYYQVYFNSSNSVAGGIAHNAASTVAFNTSSDVRLKENIVDAPSVLDKILSAQVRSFDWKEDGHHVDYGFIAQELYQQLPEVVGKGDDETELTDAKGTWQVEYGRLTPMLVKAIQELKAIVDAQRVELDAAKADIAALKGTA